MNNPSAPSASQPNTTSYKQPRLKYQVFVSSTYRDLKQEREEVVWAILQARHIPVGMENFTATDERGWKTITRVIDDTDYYVLLLAGMYGTIDPTTNKSWTQREYEYAREKGIPVLAFIRDRSAITGDKMETDPQKAELLQKFIMQVQGSHLCKHWKSIEELPGAVALALRNKIQDDIDDEIPRPGWLRGDSIGGSAALSEFARLSSENARLQKELETARVQSAGARLQLLATDSDTTPTKIEVARKYWLYTGEGQRGRLGGISKKQTLSYTDFRNRTCWLNARIKNSGNAAARNVVVDLSFNGAANVVLYDERPISPLLPEVFPNWKTDEAKHCYIDSYSATRLRMRIKLIAPGVTEDMVSFGLVAPEASPNTRKHFSIGYTIAEEGGASEKGNIDFTVWWEDPIHFNDIDDLPDSE
ncbi:MAG: DUF4062 domain-containing protein [Myxococcaceae bacterium]|nr:DUF4062 domain-containing protein [Myxococcaceae bacterium]